MAEPTGNKFTSDSRGEPTPMPGSAMLSFSKLNPGLSGTVKAGTLIVLSDPNDQSGGFIGIGIGGVSGLLAIQEVCQAGNEEACRKVKFEGGKFLGSSSAGFAGRAALLGTMSGSWVGEGVGELLYETQWP